MSKRKKDNSADAMAAKVQIREQVLAAIGAPAAVFETHAGTGVMRRACYGDAVRWMGCDIRPLPDVIRYDSRKVLRAVDLQPFNVFDVDAYASPFEHAWIIAQRRRLEPGERIGLIMTDGSLMGKAVKFGAARSVWSRQMAAVVDVPQCYNLVGRKSGPKVGLERSQWITRQLLAAWFPRVVKMWSHLGGAVNNMLYYGAVIEGRQERGG